MLFCTGDFDSSTVTFNFNTAATEVKEDYTYNAVLEDDSDDENVEGFILYFEFMEDQLIPDDFSRLSQTTAVTLVTIIDNDGRKLLFIEVQFGFSYPPHSVIVIHFCLLLHSEADLYTNTFEHHYSECVL